MKMKTFLIISLTVFLTQTCSTEKIEDYSTDVLVFQKKSPTASDMYRMVQEFNQSDPDQPLFPMKIKKCCKDDETLDNETMICIQEGKHKQISNMTTYHLEGGDFLVKDLKRRCDAYRLEHQHYLQSELSFVLKNRSDLSSEDYCVENFPKQNPHSMFLCFKNKKYKCEGMAVMFILGIMASIVCLGLSIMIYSLFPDLRSLYGKSLMCYMISALLVFLLYATILKSREDFSGTNFCTALGFMMYAAVLSTFFWLNVVCFDIYVAFSSLRGFDSEMGTNKKNILYVMYAVGGPVVMVVIIMILELHPEIPETIYKPEFYNTCWFKERSSEIYYFITPVGVLLGGNLIFFLLTTRNIYGVQKETGKLRIASNERQNKKINNARFRLYFKLSTVMGTNWIVELVMRMTDCGSCPCIIIHGLSMYQGFLISVILVFNKKVKELLIKRFLPRVSGIFSRKKNQEEKDLVTTSEKEQPDFSKKTFTDTSSNV